MPEFAEQLGDGLVFQFETSPIDDEACRRSGDALDFDEAMGLLQASVSTRSTMRSASPTIGASSIEP